MTFSMGEVLKLSWKHAHFVEEYLKDFSPRRASEASGHDSEEGYILLKRKEIIDAVECVLKHRHSQVSEINSDWVLKEMVDNHKIARQQGNIPASNASLVMIAKHKAVDAFASGKVEISNGASVIDRLKEARRRVLGHNVDPINETSFL
jgi:4-hydroxy-L-threonine phosphate dehydrogenase PdxA